MKRLVRLDVEAPSFFFADLEAAVVAAEDAEEVPAADEAAARPSIPAFVWW